MDAQTQPAAETDPPGGAEEQGCTSLQEKLRQAHRVRVLGELSSSLIHDLNNILGGICGYADLTLRVTQEDDASKEYAEAIAKAARRGMRRARQLPAFSKQVDTPQIPADLHELITDLLPLLTHQLGSQIHVYPRLEASRSTIHCDVHAIQCALIDLAANARDAMPEGGSFSLRTRNLQLSADTAREFLVPAQPGPCIEIVAADSGAGMPATVLKRATEPFFSTKTESGASGLGLTMVRECAQAHGAGMQLVSEPGHGTAICLLFAQCAGSATAPPPPAPAPKHGSGHILVVDDEESVAEAISRMLESFGYTTTVCSGGEAALAALESERFDLAILDMLMPGMNGLELFRRLRAHAPDLRALLCSGFTSKMTDEELLAEGFSGVLAKPFLTEDLTAKVQASLAQPAPPATAPAPSPEPTPKAQPLPPAAPLAPAVTAPDRLRILVVDDEETTRESLALQLQQRGHTVDTAASGQAALTRFGESPFDVVLTDLFMHDISGIDVLRGIRERQPEAIVFVMTAYATVESSLDALRQGADEYFPKPLNIEHLELVTSRVCAERELRREHEALLQTEGRTDALCDLVGASLPMNVLYRHIRALAASRMTVLIQGETGVGKELVARAIHRLSPRQEKRFIPVNCASLPDSLLESELFGHVKGAFTGATQDKWGLFAAAEGGTLLLDEIEAASPRAQATLLRTLDNHEVLPVGARKPVPVNVRVLVSSNRDLESMVEDGSFREDLFFRIAESTVPVPPLRQRAEDIPLLAQHFFNRIEPDETRRSRQFSPQALNVLSRYRWPGNVRELKSLVHNLAHTAPRPLIRPADLPPKLHDAQAQSSPTSSLAESEAKAVREALRLSHGNKAEAARLLQIPRKRLYSLIKRHNIPTEPSNAE